MVRPKFEIDVSYDVDSHSRIQIVSCKPDRIFYIPVPNADNCLAALHAGICAFACAVNQHSGKCLVRIKHRFPLPQVFIGCMEDFNTLSAYSNVEFTGPRAADFKCTVMAPFKIAHLLSGGKDSVYQLTKLIEKHGKQNITAVYVGGTTINAEYRSELDVVKRISELLDVNLSYVHLEHGDYEGKSLRVRIRTIWRDLLLFCIARMFGQNVSTGITADPHFDELEKDILAGARDPHDFQGAALYFSNTSSAMYAMSSSLGCRILITDPEIVVLREMERRWPELMAICRSCYNPARTCEVDTNWEGSCSKCKTLAVLRSIIYRSQITSRHARFALSSLSQSDATIGTIIRRCVAASDAKEDVPVSFKEVLQLYE